MQQDLDRIIDQAAEQIVGQEPSNALTDAVMTAIVYGRSSMVDGRIVDSRWSIIDRRLAWAAAGAVACGVLALMMPNRTPPATRQAPVSPPAFAAAALEVAPATPPMAEAPRARAVPINRVMRPSLSAMLPPIEDELASAIAPITVAPISFDSLDVAPLQLSSLELPQIDVEPLTIAPLDN